MKRKGEITMGLMIMTFVAVIVGAALIAPGISTPIATLTTTQAVVNQSYTFPNAAASITLGGQANTNVVVVNATSGAVVPSSNYTVANYVLSNGELISTLTGAASLYNGDPVGISSTREPYGYATDGGTRAVAALVVLFAALSIGLIAAWPIIKERWDL